MKVRLVNVEYDIDQFVDVDDGATRLSFPVQSHHRRVGLVFQPCECGCGRWSDGGRLEGAHPEDYRYERG